MKKLIYLVFFSFLLAAPINAEAWWPKGILMFDGYPVALSEEYFNVLYGAVYKKYLWSNKLSDIASQSIAAIHDLDDNIRIANESERILVYNNHKMLKSFKKPSESSIPDWSKLTVEIIITARNYSKKMQNLRPEDIHQRMTESVISMLDGFSHYIRKGAISDKAKNFAETGIRVKKTGRLLEVISIIAGSSAENANVHIGNFISHIDEESVSPMDSQILIDKLNGNAGSKVVLTVINNETREVNKIPIVRTLISPNPVNYSIENDILFIVIYGFNKATVGAVSDAISNANLTNNNKINGVVIDLRGNPGGIFEQAIKTADLFLDEGTIISTRGRHHESYVLYNAEKDTKIAKDVPMIVMVDAKTASSAEIFAAALQDNGRALIFGTATYGKGTIQTLVTLPDKNEISITWSRFHAPSGYSLHHLGILPNICYPKKDITSKETLREDFTKNIELIKKYFNAWQRTNPDNKKAQEQVRAICPPQDRFFENDDKKIALELILDVDFYKTANFFAK